MESNQLYGLGFIIFRTMCILLRQVCMVARRLFSSVLIFPNAVFIRSLLGEAAA